MAGYSMWVLIALVTMVTMIYMMSPALGHSTEDLELDPEGPNVCSRRVRENKYIVRNFSRSCYRLEFRPPPCRRGYFPYWDYHRRGRGHHGHGWHGRRRRDTSDSVDTDDAISTTTEAPNRGSCCRSVRGSCWYISIRCISVEVSKYYCCPGHEPDGSGGCKLEVECSVNNGGCEQMCYRDEEDEHRCACFSGYNLVNDNQCEDVDECAVGNGGCNQNCVNIPGSYYCTCDSGYELTSPNNCTEINECETLNGGCDQMCVNRAGSHYCQCEEGFRLVNGTGCEDVDECLVGNGGCSHICENDFGGYSCSCPEGFQIDDSGFSCLADEPVVVRDPTPGVIEPLPVSSLAQTMSQPAVYGGILGGLLLLVIIACLIFFLTRCCRKRPVTVAAQTAIFVVGKKEKKMVLGPGAQLGEKPPIEYDVESVDFDMFDVKGKENDYTGPPSVISYGSEPPPYSAEDGYEDVDSIKDIKMPVDADNAFENATYGNREDDNAYENMAFENNKDTKSNK